MTQERYSIDAKTCFRSRPTPIWPKRMALLVMDSIPFGHGQRHFCQRMCWCAHGIGGTSGTDGTSETTWNAPRLLPVPRVSHSLTCPTTAILPFPNPPLLFLERSHNSKIPSALSASRRLCVRKTNPPITQSTNPPILQSPHQSSAPPHLRVSQTTRPQYDKGRGSRRALLSHISGSSADCSCL